MIETLGKKFDYYFGTKEWLDDGSYFIPVNECLTGNCDVKVMLKKWSLQINGIQQIDINGSEKFIGTRKGKVERIELMDGEEIEKLTFSGLN